MLAADLETLLKDHPSAGCTKAAKTAAALTKAVKQTMVFDKSEGNYVECHSADHLCFKEAHQNRRTGKPSFCVQPSGNSQTSSALGFRGPIPLEGKQDSRRHNLQSFLLIGYNALDQFEVIDVW